MALDSASSVEARAPRPRSLWRRPGVWIVLFLSFALAGWVGYVAGEHHSDIRTLTGTGYVGDNQASVGVHGWIYGFTLDSVSWTDAEGSLHDAGTIPDCLSHVGTATIRFAEVPASTPVGVSWRQVFWVDCRATTYDSTP